MADDGSSLPNRHKIFFRRQCQLHFQLAFPNLQKEMKNTASEDKQPELVLCARRLVYRWLTSLLKEKTITNYPIEVTDWLVIDGPRACFHLSGTTWISLLGSVSGVLGGWITQQAKFPLLREICMRGGKQ
ncbi:hypothetical protein O6H91_11G097900 [Diphasiastrum complanatum]|uniref:Uncharacterized protein n=1 Tax=Diphasiastrum complanatum TaxID=34168 RepID=A0ACC2CBV4_DIPCM|nr:hypothetical protein O6H91_11G097900 [Diphasiastrum complanatum]